MLRGTFSASFYRISALGIAFLISVVTARLLGLEAYGSLQFTLSITQLAQLGFGMGMSTLVLRASGEEATAADPRGLDVLIRRAVVSFLCILFLVAGLGVALLGWFDWSVQIGLLGVAASFSIAQHTTGIYRSALIGKSRFVAAGFGEFAASISALLLLGGILLFSAYRELDPTLVLLVRTGTAAIGATFLYLSWKQQRNTISRCLAEDFDCSAILRMCRTGFPLMLIGLGAIMNSSADIILLGLMRSSGEVGHYHVAARAAGLVGLPLAVMMVPMSPIISNLYLENRRELRRVFFRTTAIIGAASFLVGLALVLFMKQFFGLFGADFLGAGAIAIALGIAQLVNACFGPLQQLLIMTGHERQATQAMLIGVAANVLLNLILIPSLGALGAAIGTGIGIMINSLINAISVWSKLFSKQALSATLVS